MKIGSRFSRSTVALAEKAVLRVFVYSATPMPLIATVILIEWEDLEHARRFAQSEDLRETMERAGVAEQPDIYFLEEVETVPE